MQGRGVPNEIQQLYLWTSLNVYQSENGFQGLRSVVLDSWRNRSEISDPGVKSFHGDPAL